MLDTNPNNSHIRKCTLRTLSRICVSRSEPLNKCAKIPIRRLPENRWRRCWTSTLVGYDVETLSECTNAPIAFQAKVIGEDANRVCSNHTICEVFITFYFRYYRKTVVVFSPFTRQDLQPLPDLGLSHALRDE